MRFILMLSTLFFIVCIPALAGESKPRVVQNIPVNSLDDLFYSGLMRVTPNEFVPKESSRSLSVAEVLAFVLSNNHEIRIAAHGPVQARTYIMEAKSAYDPRLFTEWRHNRDGTPDIVGYQGLYDNELRNTTERIGVRQRLPSGGELLSYREWSQGEERNSNSGPQGGRGGAFVLEVSQPLLYGIGNKETRTMIEIAHMQTDSASQDFRRAVIRAFSDALEAYWSVALAEEEIRIHLETVEMASMLLSREGSRRAEGIAMELDVHRAREALATRNNNLLIAREQYQTAQENLKLMIGGMQRSFDFDMDITAADVLEAPLFVPDTVTAIDTALTNRPEIRAANLAVDIGEKRNALARHGLLPQMDLSGSIRHNDRNSNNPATQSSADARGLDWSVGVSFSLPLGNMEARAKLRRSSSELEQKIDEEKNTRSFVITETKAAAQALKLIVHEIPMSERAVNAAKTVVEGEWARLELNQTGNRDLLQAQDLLAMAKRSRVQSLARYRIALIRFFVAEGTLLKRLGLDVGWAP